MDYEWLATGKGDTIYIHLFEWPGGTFTLENMEPKITRAYLLADPDTGLETTRSGTTLSVTLPPVSPDEIATVLCLTRR